MRATSIRCDFTYANRLKVPVTPEQKSWANIKRGLTMLRNIFWKIGVLGDYRRVFWKFALQRLRHGDIEDLIAVGAGRAPSDHVRAPGFGRARITPRTTRSGCARPRFPPSNP